MDSERGDMGEVNMIMKNVIIITCHNFIKMSAHMENEFTEIRTINRWTMSSIKVSQIC